MNTLNNLRLFETFDDFCLLLDTLKKRGGLSLLEKDLSLEKLRTMYDIISKCDAIESSPSYFDSMKPVEEQKISPPPPSPTVVETKTEEPAQEKVSTVVKEEKTETLPEEQTVEKPIPIKEDTKPTVNFIAEEVKKTQENNKSAKSDVLGDKYTGNRKVLGDQISEKHHPSDIADKIQSKPIADIGRAIGLNDKFLYINELFNGDSPLYKKTIEHLNNLSNINDAFSYLHDTFDWDLEDENVRKFMDIVRRKYISLDL